MARAVLLLVLVALLAAVIFVVVSVASHGQRNRFKDQRKELDVAVALDEITEEEYAERSLKLDDAEARARLKRRWSG